MSSPPCEPDDAGDPRRRDARTRRRRRGFGDGDELLTRELDELGNYLIATIDLIQRALAADGATMHVCVVPTHHNVLRVGAALRTANGATIDDEQWIAHALAHIEVPIWAYDFDGISESMK